MLVQEQNLEEHYSAEAQEQIMTDLLLQSVNVYEDMMLSSLKHHLLY